MRILLPITHALHARNWLASGQHDRLHGAGITVDVVASEEIRREWGDLPHGCCWLPLEPFVGGRARAKVREALRLACLVSGAQRGSRTYRHKLTLKRPWLARQELRAWRWLSRLRDPERIASAIERMLPIPAWVQTLPLNFYDLIVLPTLIHEDNAQNDVVKAAKAKGVRVLAVPASWDTLTTKGSFLVRPDTLAVWGIHSRQDALAIHGFQTTTVAISGPPWFWPYCKPPKVVSRHLLFAGTSVHYAPDELEVLRAVTEAINPTKVVYRPHPRRGANWPLNPGETTRTAEQVAASYALVTAFSTMIVEAALCGIPSVVLAFGRSLEDGGALGSSGAAKDGLAHLNEYEHMAAIRGQYGVVTAKNLLTVCDALRGFAREPKDPSLLRAWALRIADVDRDPRDRMVEAVKWAAER